MKKLSICIPTYNRQDFLKRLLDNCIKETAGIEKFVEVCVSDNGSTDKTEKILKEYSLKSRLIRFRRNRKNLGFDSNLISVLSMARGEYCWIIGDDDLFLKDSIKEILEIIDLKNPDFIISEFKSSFHGNYINWKKNSEIEDNEQIRKIFLNKFSELSFISSNIIKKKIFLEIKKKLPRNANGFMHTLIQFHSLNKIKKLFITQKTAVFDSSEGVFPTKKTALQIYLKTGNAAKEIREKKLINKEEYDALIERLYPEFFLHLIFYNFAIKEDGCTKEELEKIKNEIYNKFIKKTKNDNMKIHLSFLIIKSKFLLHIFKMGYFFIYVKIMNLFRKDKKQIAWEFWKKNRSAGGRRNYF
jgi:glycosyltransferase involved in cell wall biosynthesis